LALMGQDSEVMEHFPGLLTREESDAMADRIEAHFHANDFGLWAVEIPGQAPFAGFIGLMIPSFEANFTPCVEIGWRLARPFWERGYATEGAMAALDFGFTRLNLKEIVAFTSPDNARSISVMKRIGMTFAEEFEHPRIAPGHRLRLHLLYRLKREQWTRRVTATGDSSSTGAGNLDARPGVSPLR